jgi:lipoprotein NlpD
MIRPYYLRSLSFLIIILLAGCSGLRGPAPVTDRTGGTSSSADRWVTVRKGDTLFSISFANGRSHQSVARLNNIKPPYTIYPGQRIKVSGKTPVPARKHNTASSKQSRKTSRGTKKTSTSQQVVSKKSSVSWAWPVNGRIIRSYSAKAPRKKGIGITGKRGQAISAAATGKVVYSGDGLLGYGNLIIVKHNETYLSAYAHSLNVFVKEGQQVKRGQKLASMGNNENGTPMLHFEIRRLGKPVNPVSYLPRR